MKSSAVVLAITMVVSVASILFFPKNSTGAPPAEARQGLSLRQAVIWTLEHSPDLAVFPFERRALEARQLQAGLRPNPELGIMVENVLGTGTVRGFQAAESTLQLSQLLELGGKRMARITVVSREQEVAAADYEVRRADVLAGVGHAFVRTLLAQELLVLTRERLEHSTFIARTTDDLVRSGKVSPIDLIRANAAVASVRIEVRRDEHAFRSEAAKLVAWWGGRDVETNNLTGSLDDIPGVPSMDAMLRKLHDNPDQKRWLAEISRRHAEVMLADAQSVPGLTLSGSLRELSGPDDRAFVLAFSLPLMVNDRRQGAREEARQRVHLADAERAAAEVRIMAGLRSLYEGLQAAHAEAKSVAMDILPKTRDVMDAVKQGHEAGKFGYLDVLESQREWFKAREQWLRSLASVQMHIIQIERLLGTPISTGADRQISSDKQP